MLQLPWNKGQESELLQVLGVSDEMVYHNFVKISLTFFLDKYAKNKQSLRDNSCGHIF